MSQRTKYQIITKNGEETYELHEAEMPYGNRAFHESIGNTVKELPISEVKHDNVVPATVFVFAVVTLTYVAANKILN